MKAIQITCVVGARPNFIKIAAILHELRQRPTFRTRLVHTGQHFSPEMSQSFFEDLCIPPPDLNLEVGACTPTAQTAAIMNGLENDFLNNRPDVVLVVGDVNSTLAAALVAPKLGIPLAHVEAGLRSFDRGMPEELNRLMTDAVSDFLFVSEPAGVANLSREGVASEKIFFVGNVMIDTLLRFSERARQSDVLTRLSLSRKQYVLVTLHRPSNVDDAERLSAFADMLKQLSSYTPVVFPIHPRTRHKLETTGVSLEGLQLIPPIGYLDFLCLMTHAKVVLTDSGGIQEETTILQTPCLTLRDNTERPVTVEQGTNRLAGTDPATIFELALETLHRPLGWGKVPELWDGKAASRISDVLELKLRRPTFSASA